MRKIDEVLKYLGAPYSITTIDGEPVIYRSFKGFDFEVSGINGRSKNYTLYVWRTIPSTEVIGVYSGIQGNEALKDILGYYAVKYQNLISRIRVEREE